MNLKGPKIFRIVFNCTKKIKKSSEWFEILTTFEQKSIMCKLELVLDWHNGLISLVAQRRTTVHSRLNLGLVIKSDFFGWFVFGSSHLLILFLYNLFHIYCCRCKTSKRVFRSSNWPDLTIWWDSEARKIYFILLYTSMCSRSMAARSVLVDYGVWVNLSLMLVLKCSMYPYYLKRYGYGATFGYWEVDSTTDTHEKSSSCIWPALHKKKIEWGPKWPKST